MDSSNLVPLVDGDILRYEIGYAAEVGWKEITGDPEAVPPFDYVKDMLHQRLRLICTDIGTNQEPVLYLTTGRTFRYDIAKTQPYKGAREDKKPWHFNNLTAYMKGELEAKVVSYIEADDAIAIDHTASDGKTIIVSRDKDLRQVPGWFYSWELGAQPSFGPHFITKEGSLSLSDDRKKLSGTGLPFFYAQLLMGDRVDNIPGLPKYGPVKVYNLLKDKSLREMYEIVFKEYCNYNGEPDYWDGTLYLLEQGQLLWIVRELDKEGKPVLWQIGKED